jgi:hypothetical protein
LPPTRRRIAPRICSDLIFDRHSQATVYQRSLTGEEDRRRLLAMRLRRRCCRMKATKGALRLPSAAEVPRSGRSRQSRSQGSRENVERAGRLQHPFRLLVLERRAQAMDDRRTIALGGNRSSMLYRQPTKYRFQRRCELVERFQERNFLTVAMTVGKMDEGGRRAQNQ